MHNLITRGRQFSAYNGMVNFYADLDDGHPFTRTMGPEILNAPYSKMLRQTVLRCLAYLPVRRPEPRALVRIIDAALVACPAAGPDQGIGAGFHAGILDYQEPNLSSHWDAGHQMNWTA